MIVKVKEVRCDLCNEVIGSTNNTYPHKWIRMEFDDTNIFKKITKNKYIDICNNCMSKIEEYILGDKSNDR